ncbi:DNA-binding protein rfx2 [Thoreauomyces humboldtii]|nr:DNA-binding protein rfx2 [Thoreauomyces humboldtii]
MEAPEVLSSLEVDLAAQVTKRESEGGLTVDNKPPIDHRYHSPNIHATGTVTPCDVESYDELDHSGDDHDGNPDNARETQVPTESDMRQMMLESKDTLEQLAQKAAMTGPQADKARSILVTQWLVENYEPCEKNSIPRSNLYDHYCSYCLESKIDPVNSASFGKLIRTVFPEIRTRRLGTRGKSKYHYCGIRIRMATSPTPPVQSTTAAIIAAAHARDAEASQNTAGLAIDHDTLGTQEQQLDKTHIAKMPELPELVEAQVPSNLSFQQCRQYLEGYKQHCQTLLRSIQYMKFNEVEAIIKNYWECLTSQDRDIAHSDEIVEYIWRYDSLLYDTIMNLLLPNVLQMMPIQIIQAVRQFARQLEGWMLTSLEGYSQLLTSRKVEVVKVFVQQLRRHTSLNHLAQAAAAVLDNQEQVNQMLIDWNRIDFENIRDQASWVCECRKEDIVQVMELDFRQLLTTSGKLELWTGWLETVVNRFLDETLDPQKYVYVARQFLLKWAFYSSLAMRDLTLRSATSFGSFHLLRLLFDEYIFYLVEQRIANIKAFEQQTHQHQQQSVTVAVATQPQSGTTRPW